MVSLSPDPLPLTPLPGTLLFTALKALPHRSPDRWPEPLYTWGKNGPERVDFNQKHPGSRFPNSLNAKCLFQHLGREDRIGVTFQD